jgi:hypothetical protein
MKLPAILLFLLTISAHADTITVCSNTSISAATRELPSTQWQGTLSSTSTMGPCVAPVPPPVLGACTTGTRGDVPGYTALCSGAMKLKNSAGPPINKGPFAYSYPNVFGAAWPGSYLGQTSIFNVGKTQFLSIPFVASPAHAVAFVENQTYTPQPVTFSVSTAPGLFNGGVKNGTTVICVASRNPNLTVASRYFPTAQCKITTTGTYWFNIVIGSYNVTTGVWIPGCATLACGVGVQINDQG